MPEPVRPHRDLVERIHQAVAKIVAGLLIGNAVVLLGAHALGLSEGLHIPEEYLVPIGLSLVGFFYLAVVYGQKKIEGQLDQLQVSAGPRDPEWANQIKRSIPDDLSEIFVQEIDRSCQTLRSAIVDQEFVIRNVKLTDRFSSAYGRILQRFPQSTFYATAPANKQYWNVFLSNFEGSPNVIDEFKRFLKGARSGAAMKRIFLVNDPQRLSLEECEIIRPQVGLLTATYIASMQRVRDMDCLRYFAVEARGGVEPRLSWEVKTDGFEVTEVVTSLDRGKAKNLLSDWHRIVQLFPTPVTVDQIDKRIAELQPPKPAI